LRAPKTAYSVKGTTGGTERKTTSDGRSPNTKQGQNTGGSRPRLVPGTNACGGVTASMDTTPSQDNGSRQGWFPPQEGLVVPLEKRGRKKTPLRPPRTR